MNKWKCNHKECTNTAIGIGGAAGLRAIGWYFVPGFNTLFCPIHRPDPIPCEEPGYSKEPCINCSANKDAKEFQEIIYDLRDLEKPKPFWE